MPQSHTATSMLTFCACTQWLGGLPVHAVDAAGAVGPPGAPGGIGAGRSTMGSCPSPMLAGARTEAGSCRTLGPEVLLSCVCVCGWVWVGGWLLSPIHTFDPLTALGGGASIIDYYRSSTSSVQRRPPSLPETVHLQPLDCPPSEYSPVFAAGLRLPLRQLAGANSRQTR